MLLLNVLLLNVEAISSVYNSHYILGTLVEICLLLISKVRKKGEKFYFIFFPFLAQTMHRMRPGGVTNLHI